MPERHPESPVAAWAKGAAAATRSRTRSAAVEDADVAFAAGRSVDDFAVVVPQLELLLEVSPHVILCSERVFCVLVGLAGSLAPGERRVGRERW